MSMTGELERQNGEQRSEINSIKSDAAHRINLLEDRQKARMAEMRDGGILSRIRQLLGAQTWKEPIRSWYNDRIDGIPTTDKVHHGSPSPG